MLNFKSESEPGRYSEGWEKDPTDLRNRTDTVLITIKNNLDDGYHENTFDLNRHKIAKDSGGFNFLGNPELALDFNVDGLIEKHKKIGVHETDIIISADFPVPRFAGISANEMKDRQQMTRDWFEQMTVDIPQTIPVLHGLTAADLIANQFDYDLAKGTMVAVGSNLAQTTHRIYDKLNGGKKGATAKKLVSKKMIWDTIIDTAAGLRREDREFFMLGAGGMNASKLCALLGANCVDATSWRGNAMLRQIFDTVHGRYIKVGDERNNMNREWAQQHLREIWNDETYPFGREAGLTFNDMTYLLRTSNDARCAHNVWELEADSKRLTEYEDDPDGLYRHLKAGWSSTSWTDYQNLKRLDQAYASINDASVQTTFDNFAKS